MTSRRPPSIRDATYALRHQGRQLQSMSPGAVGGRLASAAPVLSSFAEADLDLSDDLASAAAVFAHDRFSLTGATPSLTLSEVPMDNSLHVYLNGIEQDENTDYTVSGLTVNVLAAMGALSADVVDCRYAYLDNLPFVVPGLDVVVDYNATGWKYSTVAQLSTDYATDGVEGSTTWAGPTFDDSAWSTGQAPFGWGYAGVVGATPRNTTLTALSEVFMRQTLTGSGTDWSINMKVDNWGFLYFNGNRLTGNMPSGAQSGADSGTLQTFGPFTIPQAWVRSDFNVVAFHVQDQAGGGGYGAGDVLLADIQVLANL